MANKHPQPIGAKAQARTREVLSDAAPEVRAETAERFAAEFASGGLSPRERAVAAKVLEVFAADVAQEVRMAVAEQVKSCLYLPRNIALKLASDIDSVAIPILRYTSALTDDDLIAIVRGGSNAKQIAIANREQVSEALSSALIDAGRKVVTSAVLANAGAAVAEADLTKVLDTHPDDADIQTLLATRPTLPAALIERLIAVASEALRATLLARDDVPSDVASRLVDLGRDGAMAARIRSSADPQEIEAAIARAAEEKRLTPMFVLRAICAGDIELFEQSIAALARMPVSSARDFLYGRGAGGQRKVFLLARMPDQLLHGLRAAIKLYEERRTADPEGWRSNFTTLIIDRLVVIYPTLAPGSLETVLSQISHRILGRPEPAD